MISETVGHLERRWPIVELAVVRAIVFLVFSTTRTTPKAQPAEEEGQPVRTPGGRLTVQAPPEQAPSEFDEQNAPRWFALAAIGACALVAGATRQ